MDFFTNHIKDTKNPQSYYQHGKFAFINSAKITIAGLLGMVHAIFPWWFPFVTSTAVIKSFKSLVDSKRHVTELNEIMPDGYLLKKHLK